MLEIIAVLPEEARIAERAGAERIELVSALAEGGLTPGLGLVRQTVASVGIPVNVMVRPHSRSFHYSASELEVMREEILALRETGAHGIVLGMLDAQGRVGVHALEYLLAAVGNLAVTFHKAVDASRDPVESVRLLSGYPAITTVLTSGGPGSAGDNLDMLNRMREAAGAIRLMAGGGLDHGNTARVAATGAVQDYHYGTAVRVGRKVDGPVDPERVGELVRILGVAARAFAGEESPVP